MREAAGPCAALIRRFVCDHACHVLIHAVGPRRYSEDYDSYGWANVTTPFGGAKGLSAEGALFSRPAQVSMPLAAGLDIRLTEVVPAFPGPPSETGSQKCTICTITSAGGRCSDPDPDLTAHIT